MHAISVLVVLTWSVLTMGVGSVNLPLVPAFPVCSIICLDRTDGYGSCNPSNTTCLCLNPQFLSDFSGCIGEHCTVQKDVNQSMNSLNVTCQQNGVDISTVITTSTTVASAASTASASATGAMSFNPGGPIMTVNSITPTPDSTTPSPASASSTTLTATTTTTHTAAIVGGLVGGILGTGLLIGIIVFLILRRRKMSRRLQQQGDKSSTDQLWTRE